MVVRSGASSATVGLRTTVGAIEPRAPSGAGPWCSTAGSVATVASGAWSSELVWQEPTPMRMRMVRRATAIARPSEADFECKFEEGRGGGGVRAMPVG